jgi:hypothetical protein
MYGAFGHCRARKAPMITSFPLRRPSMSPKTSNTPATYLETERRPVTGVKGCAQVGHPTYLWIGCLYISEVVEITALPQYLPVRPKLSKLRLNCQRQAARRELYDKRRYIECVD